MPLYRIGKVWYTDIASLSGRDRRSTKTTDLREARAVYQRRKKEIWRRDQLGEAPSITWIEAVARWMEETNPRLEDRYRLRSFSVDENTALPLSAASITEGIKSGLSAGSWNRLLSIVQTIHKLSGLNPPSVTRKPTPTGRTRHLSAKEWSRLQEALKAESPLLLQAARFTLATGLRENNVLELEWSQVDLKRKTLVIHPDQFKTRVTLGLPLNDDALAVLKARRGLNKRWVFAHPDSGKPLVKASNRAWYNALKKSGLYKTGVVWHSLRHTFASWAVMRGVSLLELQQLGGWKTFSMVQRYAHLAPDHLRAAVNKVKPV